MRLCLNSCICTTASLHTLSLRQQFGADLLISIATITRVGGGDIKKIDCHKKATVQQKEGDCNRGVTQSAALPPSGGVRPRPRAGGLCFIKNKHERTTPPGYQTSGDKDGEISLGDRKKMRGVTESCCRELSWGSNTWCVASLLYLSSRLLPSFAYLFFFYPTAPVYTPLISLLPLFANTLTPPNESSAW